MRKAILTNTYLRIIVAFAISSALPSHAEEPTLAERIPEYLKQQDNSFITLTVENDLFGAGTDENYTSGVRLTYFDDKAYTPEFVKAIGDAVPFFDVNDTTNVYYSLGQNLYTPEVITTYTPNPSDRPYAALFYGSIGYSTLLNNHIDDIEVTFGVVGPAALGQPTQEIVHEWVNSPDPKGWDSQLKNEPAFILAYQRSWPEAYSANFDMLYLRVAPHAGATLGNIYSYINTGATVQLLPERHKWQAPPARVRPSIPGSGYFVIPDDEFSWSLFAGVEGRAIARNIFLDGNTFVDSSSVDKKHGVLDINAGATIAYGRVQMAYTLNWRSDEFAGQRDNSLFGSVSLGYRF